MPLPVCSGVSIVHNVDLPDVFPVHGSLVRLVLVNHLNDNQQSGAKQVHVLGSVTRKLNKVSKLDTSQNTNLCRDGHRPIVLFEPLRQAADVAPVLDHLVDVGCGQLADVLHTKRRRRDRGETNYWECWIVFSHFIKIVVVQ